jgi:hypothetical protein
MKLTMQTGKIKNKFNQIMRFFDRDPERIELRATRDWNLILSFFIFVNVVILIASTIFFFSVNKRELLPVTELTADSMSRLDKDKVQKAAKVVAEKERIFQELLNSPIKVVDPSL